MLKKLLGLGSACAIFYTGCVSNKPAVTPFPVSNQPGYLEKVYEPMGGYFKPGRGPASTADTERIAYYTREKSGQESIQIYTPENWRALKPGRRHDLLMRFYSADQRAVSRSGRTHEVCFTGQARTLLEKFFSPNETANKIENIRDFTASWSSDGFMFGLQFVGNNGPKHIRLTSCRAAGKSQMAIQKLLEQKLAQDATTEAVAPEALVADPNTGSNVPPMGGGEGSKGPADGFTVDDPVQNAGNLPRFSLKTDFKEAKLDVVPYLDANLQSKFDLSNKEQAYAFALALQEYVYEGMVDQNPRDPDDNFNAWNSKKRYWCHMPWLNQGPKGREAIHGMTEELKLGPSTIWPKTPVGGDWGVAYFNAAGCNAIEKVFGSYKKDDKGKVIYDERVANPTFANLQMENGTIIYKILFTTANFPEIQNAFQWKANASDPVNKQRRIRPMRHIQMDIAVKDTRLAGLAQENGLIADGWVMLTYYYDENYVSPLKMKMPEGFKHMRPMGIQSGFRSQEPDSIIFAGAKTNQVGDKMRLNGPADNAKSSCLGCHGAAGSTTSMVPGVEATEQWREIKVKEAHTQLEFGQQFALAKRNYETRPR